MRHVLFALAASFAAGWLIVYGHLCLATAPGFAGMLVALDWVFNEKYEG